ncbi:MAG: TonB-dependent receptor [Chitinivibrionia bacterium]|nr:TonB-dependent receptor [Chitinivibrionia bacterium]
MGVTLRKLPLILGSLFVLADIDMAAGEEPDITVTATRGEAESFYVPQSVSIVTGEKIVERNARTTPEALQEEVGILVQETAYGHGSPFIRGLTGKHTLILVDGIRFNNSTFRFGPNQYLNNIDPAVIDRIEVVRGPASVLYGSDAIGGVIHVITKRREDFSSPRDIDGALTGWYGSSDNSEAGRVEVNGNFRNFGLIGGKSYRDFGDLQGGKNTGLQENTGYQENDGDLKLQYRIAPDREIVAAYRRVHQMDVPRTDKFVYNNESFVYDPQIWNAFTVAYEMRGPGSPPEGLKMTFSLNQQIEGIERQKFGSTTLRRYRDAVDTWGLSLQREDSWGNGHSLTYGMEYYADSVDSGRTDINLTTGTAAPKAGNFPDDARYDQWGIYLQDEMSVTERLSSILGLRYSQAKVEATLPAAYGRFEDAYDDVTASLGLLYALTPNFHGVVNVARGFRAPNLDDTTVLEKVTNEGIDVPSPGLEPEKSVNSEIGVKAEFSTAGGSLFYFYNDLRDLIERGPGIYNGQTYLDENGNGAEDPGEAVRQKFNIGEAYIQGVEAEGWYQVTPGWSLRGNLSWIYGQDRENREPLSRIPPVMGSAGLRWKAVSGRYWGEYDARFAGEQDRLSSRDRTDPRIDLEGTPGWTTHGLQGGADFRRLGKVTLGVENIFNRDYRIHGSGIDAPGIHFTAGYTVTF